MDTEAFVEGYMDEILATESLVGYNEGYEGFCDSCKYFIPSKENPICTVSGEEHPAMQLWRVCIQWEEKE